MSATAREAVDELPETLDGATFLDRWTATDDDVTTVDPGETYPGRGGDDASASTSTGGARPRSHAFVAVTSPRSGP